MIDPIARPDGLAPPPAGFVRVDCHMHTVASGDAVTRIEELAERVAANRIDVLCVTDHHAITGALAALERGIGARVIVGEEIRTTGGEVIGLFLTERIPYVLRTDDVVDRIHDQGGVAYAPHPFDPIRFGLRPWVLEDLCSSGRLDAIEIFNAKVADQSDNIRAAEIAARFGLPGGAGSDAHDAPGIGAAWVEMPDFDGPSDFVRKLASGRVFGEFRDHAPRYTPRRPAGVETA